MVLETCQPKGWGSIGKVSASESKTIVVSRVISVTESELEESERFHFLLTSLTTPSLTIPPLNVTSVK